MKKKFRSWLLVFCICFSIASVPARSATVTVQIQNFQFIPPSQTINAGDTVTWMNNDSTEHTSSSSTTGIWNSGVLEDGQTFSHTFNTAGTFPYLCQIHTFMTANITVQAVQQTPPVVTITSPAANTVFTTPASVTVEATATASGGTITQVEFFDLGNSIGVDTSSPFSVTATLGVGRHSLTAKATDSTGASTISSVVPISVQNPQTVPPTVAITSPTNNTTVAAASSVTIEATAAATDGSITQLEFFDGTAFLGIDNNSPYSLTTNLAIGTHSLTAKATDSNGASTTSSVVTVTVNSGGTKITDPIPQKIQKGDVTVELEMIADGLVSPVGMASPDDGSRRLFIFDQIGIVQVVTNGTNMAGTLLDVRSRLVSLNPGYDERGLIGMATHPSFAQHPFVYTYTSEPVGPTADFPIPTAAGQANDCQSVIAEWRLDPTNPNRVDPTSRREILRVDKPESNHNGGTLRFGPDGFLYFSIGDGGNANDVGPGHLPGGNAQDKTRILGKVSRIDVDARTSPNGQYGIPAENPFVGEAGAVAEIYAYGLRNPYSFSFDRQTGDLFLGDVGQNDVEEIDHIVSGGNYGWSIKEGSFFFDPNGFVTTEPVRAVPSDLIDPIAEYDHDEGEAVIGGYLYRGSALSALSGKYVTGDLGKLENPASGRLFFLDGTQLMELRIGSTDRGLGLFLKGFGQDQDGELYVMGTTSVGPSGTAGKVFKIVPLPGAVLQNSYLQSNLVSDLSGMARFTDTNLVNPWGIVAGPTTPFWISDNHTGLSTLYNSTGAVQSLVVTIPPPAGKQPPAAPTGIVFNGTTNFNVSPGAPAHFIFATEDGTIVGWNASTGAVVNFDNSSSGAVYKGLTLGSDGTNNLLYAANFNAGTIDVLDSNFEPVPFSGSFLDATIPEGFAPFNIRLIAGNLWVTYAKQDADKMDDVAGSGNGYINIFDGSGKLLKRFASNGPLNSPWGLTIAPSGFGQFQGALLVGNFGDGRINAFDPTTGAYLGQLEDQTGNPIVIQGLWDLVVGNGTQGGDSNKLYFTAGIPGDGEVEDHGLFGSLSFMSSFRLSVTRDGTNLTISWSGGTGPYTLQKKATLSDASWTDVKTLSETSTGVTIDVASGFFRVAAQATAP